MKKYWILFFLFFSFLGSLIWLREIKNQKEFEIEFLNTGQGNLTLVKYKNQNFLIDTGYDNLGIQNLKKEINFFDRKISAIFLTHFDIDHVWNTNQIVDFFKVKNIYLTSKGIDNPVKKEILKKIKEKNIPYLFLEQGDEIIIDKNLKFEILYPFKNLKNFEKDNYSSLVILIKYKNKKILITGDLPEKVEKYLVKIYGEKLKADIFLAGHHGSKNSNSEIFLKTINPKWIIFSVGKNNSYHHPNKEVLERVKKMKIQFFRTDLDGNIKFWVENNQWFWKKF